MPGIDEIDKVLEESGRVITAEALEKNVSEAINKRQEILERLQEIDLIREQRLRKVENYNPLFKRFKPS